MRNTLASEYGDTLGRNGTRAARVLLAGSRPRVLAPASLDVNRTAAVGVPPASVWSGPQRAPSVGQPVLRRARQP